MVPNYRTEEITRDEADTIVARMLKMVREKDNMFIFLHDDIIEDLIVQGWIEVDPEDETMQGTTLTEKGWEIYYKSGV